MYAAALNITVKFETSVLPTTLLNLDIKYQNADLWGLWGGGGGRCERTRCTPWLRARMLWLSVSGKHIKCRQQSALTEIITIRINYIFILRFTSIFVIIIIVIFIVATTVIFGHILATFALVRPATEICAFHVSLPALAALGGTPFLDTFALHEINYSPRCWV